ncbi:hypothetical protein IW136_000979, partial [Coemansia sp. RSA 678]
MAKSAPAPAPVDPEVALRKKVNTKAVMTNEFKGGLIVGVENSDQAKIAESVGARGVVVVVANVNLDVTDIAFAATTVTADPAVVKDILGSVL